MMQYVSFATLSSTIASYMVEALPTSAVLSQYQKQRMKYMLLIYLLPGLALIELLDSFH